MLNRAAGPRAGRGHTLVEVLCVMGMAGVLAALAYPSFQSTVLKTRRADALAALMQLQAAQERYRANHAAYGQLSDLQLPASSGSYTLSVVSAHGHGYELQAVATGLQAADTRCRHLKLSVQGMDTVRASGPTAAHANDAQENRRCWSL